MADLGRALVGRRWRWVTVVVLVVMLVLARLGVWQLDRLAERRAANAQLAAALAEPAISLNDARATFLAMTPASVPADLANRDVTLSGEYDFDQQRVVKLQSLNGLPGVHLVTPMVLSVDGAGDGDDGLEAVLVDRGWIPDAEYMAGRRFDTANGPQTVDGYIALTETIRQRAAGSAATASPNQEVFRVDIAALQEEMPYRLAPFYVRAAPAGDDSLPVEIAKEVDLSEGPHLSYAAQWFIFSLGFGAGYVLYVRRSLQHQVDLPPRTGPPASA